MFYIFLLLWFFNTNFVRKSVWANKFFMSGKNILIFRKVNFRFINFRFYKLSNFKWFLESGFIGLRGLSKKAKNQVIKKPFKMFNVFLSDKNHFINVLKQGLFIQHNLVSNNFNFRFLFFLLDEVLSFILQSFYKNFNLSFISSFWFSGTLTNFNIYRRFMMFARVIFDKITGGYLKDVFVSSFYRLEFKRLFLYFYDLRFLFGKLPSFSVFSIKEPNVSLILKEMEQKRLLSFGLASFKFFSLTLLGNVSNFLYRLIFQLICCFNFVFSIEGLRSKFFLSNKKLVILNIFASFFKDLNCFINFIFYNRLIYFFKLFNNVIFGIKRFKFFFNFNNVYKGINNILSVLFFNFNIRNFVCRLVFDSIFKDLIFKYFILLIKNHKILALYIFIFFLMFFFDMESRKAFWKGVKEAYVKFKFRRTLSIIEYRASNKGVGKNLIKQLEDRDFRGVIAKEKYIKGYDFDNFAELQYFLKLKGDLERGFEYKLVQDYYWFVRDLYKLEKDEAKRIILKREVDISHADHERRYRAINALIRPT